ncbi:MAG: hypothetical protein CM1200mP14_08610 [Gammaproteobacteria bacterium]|nr:MAG: hypothetical protein CM1200mP14_08610 [Gammaproteobacteria bacterium]
MSAKTLLKSGRLVDPSQGLDEVLDLLLVDGIVASLERTSPPRKMQMSWIALASSCRRG